MRGSVLSGHFWCWSTGEVCESLELWHLGIWLVCVLGVGWVVLGDPRGLF